MIFNFEVLHTMEGKNESFYDKTVVFAKILPNGKKLLFYSLSS